MKIYKKIYEDGSTEYVSEGGTIISDEVVEELRKISYSLEDQIKETKKFIKELEQMAKTNESNRNKTIV